MSKRFLVMLAAAIFVVSLVAIGCRGKVEKTESSEAEAMSETVSTTTDMGEMMEPAKEIATETIPPTAAPQVAQGQQVSGTPQDQLGKNKDIQTALQKAGLYTGAIDGKIGPRTKAAIIQFQKAKGLKPDGKVGPKTWAELQKSLMQ